MAVWVPWDKYETVLLIDTYVKVENRRISRDRAVKKLSGMLRERASGLTNDIDEFFRNEEDIDMRMNEIAQAMGNESCDDVPVLFQKLVKVYFSEHFIYLKILSEAQKRFGGIFNVKESFYIWLKDKTRLEIKEVDRLFSIIEAYALSKDVLSQPLFETIDRGKIVQLFAHITCNQMVQRTYRSSFQDIRELLKRYVSFLTELDQVREDEIDNVLNGDYTGLDKQASEEKSQIAAKEYVSQNTIIQELTESADEAVEGSLITENVEDVLISELKKRNIEFIDKREKGGCLWAIDCAAISDYLDDMKEKGVEFIYKAAGGRVTKNRSAWWTKSVLLDNTDLSRSSVSVPQECIQNQDAQDVIAEDENSCVEPDKMDENDNPDDSGNKEEILDLDDRETLSDRLFILLASISKDNAYGTTATYLAHVTHSSVKAVEQILKHSDWAKKEYQRYKFCGEISSYYELDFKHKKSMAFTKPIKFNYFGEGDVEVSSWRHLLIKVMEKLYEDYPDTLDKLAKRNIRGDCVDADHRSLLRSPGKISDNLYIELNRSATEIIDYLEKIFEICNVDVENLKITYRRKNNESDAVEHADVGEDITKISQKVSTDTKTTQELLKEEFHALGIPYSYMNNTYGFADYSDSQKREVTRICKKYNIKSCNIIERMGKQVWRLHLNEATTMIQEQQDTVKNASVEKEPAAISSNVKNEKQAEVNVNVDGLALYVKDEFSNWMAAQLNSKAASHYIEILEEIGVYCLKQSVINCNIFEILDREIVKSTYSLLERDTHFHEIYKENRYSYFLAIRWYIRFLEAGIVQARKLVVKSEETENVIEPVIEEEKSQLSNWSPEIIIRDNVSDLGKQVPTSFTYCEEEYNVKSWIDLYVQICSILERKNTVFFYSILGKSVVGENNIDFGDAKYYFKMRTPRLFANGRYLEADYTPEEILTRIQSLLKRISTDFAPIQIMLAKTTLCPKAEEHRKEPIQKVSIKETPVSPEIHTKQNTSEVDELLKDDLYYSLRQELSKQGIKTIAQLRTIKLWPFMNQYNLYALSTRQMVLQKVRALLENKEEACVTKDYKILCGSMRFSGSTMAEAFLHFCEEIARKYPLRIRMLIGIRVPGLGKAVLGKNGRYSNALKMENPSACIDANLSNDEALKSVKWICHMCGEYGWSVSVEAPEILSTDEKATNNVVPTQPALRERKDDSHKTAETDDKETTSEIQNENQIESLERTVLAADLDGISVSELRERTGLNAFTVKELLPQCKHVVELKDKLIHEDAFIDWDDGAQEIETIIDELMQKNGGYISAAQLFQYAHSNMNMFLNDNDMDNERAVYDIAEHLFEKVKYHGKHYAFSNKTHISECSSNTETIENIFDLCCRFAEDQGGIFKYADLVDYLARIGIGTGNLRNQLHIYDEPEFLCYEEGTFIYAKSMGINKEWKRNVSEALARLFSDVGDHVILRDVQPFWFEQLPQLPARRPWTPLLLQSVLKFYGDEFGARTIIAMESQGIDTLHTMLVNLSSPIQNFGDVVISFLLENEISQRNFEAEELRLILVQANIIHGGELYNNMHKALNKDARFAWDANNKHVLIRV